MIKVYVVPHTHWDREWYFNIDDSNILLGENLTYLINFLEANEDYPSFTFDAQGSILEEYAKIYPENIERLKKLIKNKRIFVGPWYTQTDSLLVNKESIIRNLQYGIDICESYGHSMKIGYLPDIFGQNQYLPSIFKNFEIDNAIFQRGITTDNLNGDLNFKWKAPDDKEIQTNNLYLGYGPGKFLESDEDYINNKLLPMLEKLKSLNKNSNNLLFPAGGDQVLVREHFKKVVDELNEKNLGYEFILSNYETFMEETWKEAVFNNTITGELRDTEKSRMHRTIGSSRYDIKKLNSVVENKILKILEPLGIIGESVGLEYPKRWIDFVWKLLFDVHSHDSIGGCNSDATNVDILARLEKVNRIVDANINIIKKQIVIGISKTLKREDIITIFNTELKELNESKIVVFTKGKNPVIKTLENNIVESENIESTYISGGKRIIVTAEGDKEEEIQGYYRNILILPKVKLPSLGYETFIVEEGDETKIENAQVEIDGIENNYYKITVLNGNIKLTNKQLNEDINKFIYFESTEDGGDSYDYSPVENDKALFISNFEIKEIKKNIYQEKILLTSKLNQDRKFEIETTIVIKKDSDLIQISHKLFNQEENHRLRVFINGELTNISSSYSDSGFSLIEHPVIEKKLENWKENGFVEAPVPIYNLENLLTVKNNEKQISVHCEGIKEYEIVDNNIAITLFRSIGLLGKDNLMWRPGRASGINNKIVTTPDAQLKKELEFHYAIAIGKPVNTYKVYERGEEFLRSDKFYQLQSLNTFEERLERFEIPKILKDTPSSKSVLTLNNNLFVSTIKKAFKGDELIIRVFNPGENFEDINFSNIVEEVNLKENTLKKEQQFKIKSKEYKTFKINIKN